MSTEHSVIKQYKSISHSKNDKVNLSLYLDSETFMYVLFNADFSHIVELCEVRYAESTQNTTALYERVGGFLHLFQLTNNSNLSVHIAVLNSDFTILPETFALKNKTKDILEFTSGFPVKNIYTQKFKELSFNYEIDSQLLNLLERNFNSAKIKHAGSLIINLLFSNRSLQKCDVLLNFNSVNFELVAKADNKLLYYNVFNYDNKEDVLYYLLFMMEQFSLDTNTANIAIAGQVEEQGEIVQTIKKYVKNIFFALNAVNMQGKDQKLQLPNHYYFTLLNQHLCES